MKIGLEMHFQLPTRSKLFCSCPTTSAEPNHNVCPVCLGYPGRVRRSTVRPWRPD